MINHDNKTIDVWWMREPAPGNFGDILTPYLIKKFTGYTSKFATKSFNKPVFIGCGSIISQAEPLSTIWGSGLIKADGNINPKAFYLAVRGPITYEAVKAKGLDCPPIFGDPAMLLPRLVQPSFTKEYKLGIFAHYIDMDIAKKLFSNDPEILIIDPLDANIENVIHQMARCENIISSSLHGIIVANAYGIPAAWIKLSDRLFGDDIKFKDHFACINVHHTFTRIETHHTVDTLLKLDYIRDVKFDDAPLLNSLPLPLL